MAPGTGTMAGMSWIMCSDGVCRAASFTPMNNNNDNILPSPPPPPQPPKKPVIPLDEWIKMEEHIFERLQEDEEERSVTMADFDFNNGDKQNKYLVMKLTFWIMKLFPALITKPFMIAREQS